MLKKYILILLCLQLLQCINKKNVEPIKIAINSGGSKYLNYAELKLYLNNRIKLNDKNRVLSIYIRRAEIDNLDFVIIYPNIVSINIASCTLQDMSAVKYLVHLKSIDFLQNKITRMEGLDNLVELETLYLRYNKITKIEGLEKLSKLKELDLSYNEIEVIEGLEGLTSLESFEIAMNRIKDYSGLLVLKGLKNINIYGEQQIEGGKQHIKDEKSRQILLKVIENNPDAFLYGFDWVTGK